jgi:hypothetical protein
MKTLKSIVLFLLFANLFSIMMNAQTGDFSDAYKKFKTVYEQELKQSGILGSSFVFLKDNKTLTSEFYGSANLEKNQKVTKTLFIIGRRTQNRLLESPFYNCAIEAH